MVFRRYASECAHLNGDLNEIYDHIVYTEMAWCPNAPSNVISPDEPF